MGGHPSAVVETDRIGAGVEIGPYCVVGPDVTLADGIRLHAHVVITGEVEIGPGSEVFAGAVLGKAMARHATIRRPRSGPAPVRLGAACSVGCHAVVYEGVRVGDGCLIGDHASILEGAHIGRDAVIGRSVTMHPDVRVGDRTRVLDQTHVATSSVIGADCVVSLNVSMASDRRFGVDGYSPQHVRGPHLGDRVHIGPGAVLLPGIRIDDDAVVGAGAVVTVDVLAGTHVRGVPARPVSPATAVSS
jgi:acyl-[acyl carrier protein]--UDP-N-acetylglucosamine O-acyltransferase